MIPVSSLAEAAAFFAGHLDIDPTPSRLQELFNTLVALRRRLRRRARPGIGQTRLGDRPPAHNLLMLGPPGSGKTEYIPQLPTRDADGVARYAAGSCENVLVTRASTG